jgi:hypothetical protein
MHRSLFANGLPILSNSTYAIVIPQLMWNPETPKFWIPAGVYPLGAGMTISKFIYHKMLYFYLYILRILNHVLNQVKGK